MVFLVGYFSPHVPFSLILFFFVDLDLDLLCIVYAGSYVAIGMELLALRNVRIVKLDAVRAKFYVEFGL